MPGDVVLQTWKEISDYMGRTERTLQRWEQQFGFPVHRPSGKSRGSVMALAQEIQEWTRGKPSLVQIRETPRFNRRKLAADPESISSGANPQAESPARQATPEQGRNGPFQDIVDVRRQHAELLQEQRILRESLAKTRAEHKTILRKLHQTVDAGSYLKPGSIHSPEGDDLSRGPRLRYGGRFLIG